MNITERRIALTDARHRTNQIRHILDLIDEAQELARRVGLNDPLFNALVDYIDEENYMATMAEKAEEEILVDMLNDYRIRSAISG